jgi:hypothetical protein
VNGEVPNVCGHPALEELLKLNNSLMCENWSLMTRLAEADQRFERLARNVERLAVEYAAMGSNGATGPSIAETLRLQVKVVREWKWSWSKIDHPPA